MRVHRVRDDVNFSRRSATSADPLGDLLGNATDGTGCSKRALRDGFRGFAVGQPTVGGLFVDERRVDFEHAADAVGAGELHRGKAPE